MYKQILNYFKKGTIYCKDCKYCESNNHTCCYVFKYKTKKTPQGIISDNKYKSQYELNDMNKCKYFIRWCD